jgi:hypothetical protein
MRKPSSWIDGAREIRIGPSELVLYVGSRSLARVVLRAFRCQQGDRLAVGAIDAWLCRNEVHHALPMDLVLDPWRG